MILAREHTGAQAVGYNPLFKSNRVTVEGCGLVLMQKLNIQMHKLNIHDCIEQCLIELVHEQSCRLMASFIVYYFMLLIISVTI